MEQQKNEFVRGEIYVDLTKKDVDAFREKALKAVGNFLVEGRMSEEQRNYVENELSYIVTMFKHATTAKKYDREYSMKTLAAYRKVMGIIEFIRDTTKVKTWLWNQNTTKP